MLVNVVNDQVLRTGPGRALPRGRLSPSGLNTCCLRPKSRTRTGIYLEWCRPACWTSSELQPHGRRDERELGRLVCIMALHFDGQRLGCGLGHGTAYRNRAFVFCSSGEITIRERTSGSNRANGLCWLPGKSPV